ncbi:MAG: hypothetical protein HY689_15525 [Chloroflexi bacterium]|nr:hypothetical protein [Chloroflexota bacterium]
MNTAVKTDRWLLALVGGAIALVLAGFVLLLVVQTRSPDTLPEDTPAGVVQRYLRALEEGRYAEADAYLSASAKARREQQPGGKPYPPYPVRPPGERPSTRIVLQDVQTRESTAQVTVAISRFRAPSPTEADEYSETVTFDLQREQGAWKITGPEYYFPF